VRQRCAKLVRYRAKLVALRSGLKTHVHAVLAKERIKVAMTDLFGRGGMAPLAEQQLLTLVYYGLRDAGIRCSAGQSAA
jgi:hypothetical protein